MRYAQTEVVERLEHRLANLAGLPVAQLERMNLVRYAPGQLFNEHHDGKFRPRTVFVYLNDIDDDDEGGDTFFPVLGLSFRPRKGTAVIWSNALPSGKEDSRMLHEGRAPAKCVKYGVNCFFNDQDFRALLQAGPDIPLEEGSVVHVGGLANTAGGKNVAFSLLSDPLIIAKPGLLTGEEIDHLLMHAASSEEDSTCGFARNEGLNGPFHQGTQTIRVLEAEKTPLIQQVEEKIVALCGKSYDELARLRVVRTGSCVGLCNRGSGHTSVYVCLAEQDEVWFPKVGLRLVMQSGDALFWPNTLHVEGRRCEDMRTRRTHLGAKARSGEFLPVIGLDAFFHDNPVRQQQREREFVPDSAIRESASGF